MPDNIGLPLAQRLDCAAQILTERGDVVAVKWLVRKVVAAQIQRDHAVSLRQRGKLVAIAVPELRVAMQQEDERSSASGHVVQPHAVRPQIALGAARREQSRLALG
jgi:hypothetical protein